MWRLNKPDVKRATNKDVREVANEIGLSSTVKSDLKKLYLQYDVQGGSVTPVQLSAITSADATSIHAAYDKTHEGKNLSYIRSELLEDVYKCPYCGIVQPTTLDHYMPESKYEALALCRLNLVPMCGVCNNYKGVKSFNKFIHCYYEVFPDCLFLIAKVWIRKNRFIAKFDFDSTAIGNPALEAKLRYQEKEIRLFKRIKKESTVFFSTLCSECEVTDTPSLKLWLSRRLTRYEQIYGKNDWRCALLRGLLAYPKLDIMNITNYNANPVIVNGGAI